MKLMPYADDTIWLLFGLGLAIIVGDSLAYLTLRINGWTFIGFFGTGVLVTASYYVVGTHSPRDGRGKGGG